MGDAGWTRRILRGFVRGIAALALLAVVAVGALVVAVGVEHGRPVSLPVPTGRFAVGRSIHDWVDTTADTRAPAPGTKRELLVWIWYPVTPGHTGAVDDYVPAALRPRGDGPRPPLPLRLLTRDLSQVHAHSTRSAEVAPGRHPVVIMRAGAAAGVLNYSTLAEDLASHGYVVVGFDAPHRTSVVVFPDGRTVRRTDENNPELWSVEERDRRADALLAAWTADIAFVLDRLTQVGASDSLGRFAERLDLARVGVFGHSFGGAAAARFCHDDPRCRAGIDIDGALFGNVVKEGVRQPFMLLLSDHGMASSPADRGIQADLQSFYDRSPADTRVRIAIRGANHFVFSDDGALLKSGVMRGALRLFGGLRIDGRRQLIVTAHAVHTFFDAYLAAPPMSPPAIVSPSYPELVLLP
jgi:predicted dienelactone hydrolase